MDTDSEAANKLVQLFQRDDVRKISGLSLEGTTKLFDEDLVDFYLNDMRQKPNQLYNLLDFVIYGS